MKTMYLSQPRRVPSRLFSVAASVALVWMLLSLGSPARAENGDLVAIHETLNALGIEAVDIAQDSGDGSFWVLGADGSSIKNHAVYHLSADLETHAGTIDNPHPRGDIATSTLTINRGIALRSISNTIFVLASVGPRLSQRYSLREISRVGEIIGEDVTVEPPDGDANLFGLSYDIMTRQLWTLDARNDKVVRFAADGTVTESFLLPGKVSPSTVLRGEGICFSLEEIDSRILVAYGDIFSAGPTRVLELQSEGVVHGDQRVGDPTGIEIPLLQVPDSRLRGFQFFRAGLLGVERRIAIIGSGAKIYEVEQTLSSPIPPSELSCSLTLNNQVLLRWKNNGPNEDGSYNGPIQLERNGDPLTSIPGDSEEYLDETPIEGPASYSLRGSEDSGGVLGRWSHPCGVTVGAGGLVHWAAFPGSSVFDVAENPSTGEIFVTDDLRGVVYRFDSDLNHVGEIPSPWPNPGAVAFVSSIQLGFPPQTFPNLLAVAEATGNRVRFVDPADPAAPVITTMTLRFNAVENPRIGGMSYDSTSGSFLLVERETQLIYAFTSTGTEVEACRPPEFLVGSALPTRGITYDPLLDTVQVAFSDGLVREIYPEGSCPPTDFWVSLEGLGSGYLDSGFAGGIQISGNTLIVCGRQSNALFRILLFPFSPHFVRGDFNRDSLVNLSDAVSTASYLFLGGSSPTCQDAADANDDGILDISDPVYLLFFLFVAESPPPPAPYPDPGIDPTFRDSLGCAE